MGGEPRTFTGGVRKWKWKRMHEKRAKEEGKSLLDQEKRLYEARLRSQIRAVFGYWNRAQPDEPEPALQPFSNDNSKFGRNVMRFRSSA
ncbi:hypothetical protein C1H46_019219 [Malus baccata]|uniref:Uncharacterized protein n=1 Tax=Malus baccata TaxID=106549 RepID=A0A540M9A8_MALBA|nr:hypothetical protein C1H46_019219 [Malus baccata]